MATKQRENKESYLNGALRKTATGAALGAFLAVASVNPTKAQESWAGVGRPETQFGEIVKGTVKQLKRSYEGGKSVRARVESVEASQQKDASNVLRILAGWAGIAEMPGVKSAIKTLENGNKTLLSQNEAEAVRLVLQKTADDGAEKFQKERLTRLLGWSSNSLITEN